MMRPVPTGGDGINLEVLLDRHVPFINEVAEFIHESGGKTLASILDSLQDISFPEWMSKQDSDAARQRAIKAGIRSYQEEIEAPAAELLRQRKASSCPSKVHKAARGGRDVAVLEALEPDFSRLALPPKVSSLALRVSSGLIREAAHKFAGGAYIASAHENILVFYFGHYRPTVSSPGFYLVYDSMANSLAAVPQLPASQTSWFSHCSLGSGAAVLRHRSLPGQYLIAEILRHIDGITPTNNASLWTWCSSVGRWVVKEVVLPLPSDLEEKHGYTFCADTVFAVGDTSLCWVDLLVGILMCENVQSDPVFRFIPLPDGYMVIPDPLHGRGRPEEYRSMSSSHHQVYPGPTIWFASLDGYRERCNTSELVLTRWALLPFESGSKWDGRSTKIQSLLEDNISVFSISRGPKVISSPVLSVVSSDVVYLSMRTKDAAVVLTVYEGIVVSVSMNDLQSMPACSMLASSFIKFKRRGQRLDAEGDGSYAMAHMFSS